jgi:hypothetical protein
MNLPPVRIAAAASGKGFIHLRGVGNRATDDLVRIGAASKGLLPWRLQ